MAKPIIVIGAGICGVSAALWLRRSGHEVMLIDQNAPGTGASFGNAGLLAQWAIVPVTEPGLWRHIPRYLLDPTSPLFVKWRYLPKLAPWLAQFLPHAAADKSRAITEALIPLLSDAVDQHKAMAKGTSAENWIADSAFSYAYRDRAAFEGDAYGWAMKKTAGLIPEVITGGAVREHEPILGPAISCLAVLKGQGHILNPLGYITELAAVFAQTGGKILKTKVQDFERSGDKIQAVLTDQGETEGTVVERDVPLLAMPVLPAGLELWQGARSVLPDAALCLEGVPAAIESRAGVIVFKDTISDGLSTLALLQQLVDRGIDGRRLRLVTAVCASPGLKRIGEAIPDLTLHTACIDPDLNDAGEIVPGIGDPSRRLNLRTAGRD